MFYAKSTGGFYDAGVHGDAIPPDAIEITVEEHAALLAAQSSGKYIVADAVGRPVAVDPPAPSAAAIKAAKWESIKVERDRRKAGGFKVGALWFHSDADSRIHHLGLKDKARDLIAAGGEKCYRRSLIRHFYGTAFTIPPSARMVCPVM